MKPREVLTSTRRPPSPSFLSPPLNRAAPNKKHPVISGAAVGLAVRAARVLRYGPLTLMLILLRREALPGTCLVIILSETRTRAPQGHRRREAAPNASPTAPTAPSFTQAASVTL
ncbi:hypothetical protein AAFF_G00042010 [Aldrovandia affinis]|uniref:Uncharacterized protein n=1 Tax=Aldrovandia affinis TaxID=143900 RepID=A0AAD7S2Q5_9TELE|nr:hypothetical protein AAFF_G00042010 [Aldrovandia affinis]